MSLSLFSFFHLNLAFSSIEEEQRLEVIHRCYWPLLRLIRGQRLPLGIEASGYTLEEIQRLAPDWVAELRNLCHEGLVEFIGSGYAQLIGPLVPAEINKRNQAIGLDVYRELLGIQPKLALVNEQAYSGGMVQIYRHAGYQGLIMEWDNPASCHPEWDPDWRYLPQYACSPDGASLPVIWNKSIPFQKFQRYANGEMDLPEYLVYLGSRAGSGDRTCALYGNDAEIFDFRPGRFNTETALGGESEWKRIAQLYHILQEDPRFGLIRPSQVLDFIYRKGAGNRLRLESPAQPVPVKKQPKYNLVRWAVTGRDDLGINTACWRLFENLSRHQAAREDDWKDLCVLWSSDFRTHITAKRWQNVQARLAEIQARFPADNFPGSLRESQPAARHDFQVRQEGTFLISDTPCQRLRLNCRRGLAVEGWWDKEFFEQPLIGTLPHGYFDDIRYGADFFTGHFVLEVPGPHKVTDLSNVTPEWAIESGRLVVRAMIPTRLGPVDKKMVVDSSHPGFTMSHHFHWPVCPHGTLRLGHITLNPKAFDQNSLFYSSHNGGENAEIFHFQNEAFNHLAPVSALVSASTGFGMTAGSVVRGDAERHIMIHVDKASSSVTGHMVFDLVDGSYFARLVFSAMEMDDTATHVSDRSNFSDHKITYHVGTKKGL